MTLSDENEGKPALTDDQLYILRSIALTAASMSMVSGLLVGFWFIRMKRSFRHQYAPCRHPPPPFPFPFLSVWVFRARVCVCACVCVCWSY